MRAPQLRNVPSIMLGASALATGLAALAYSLVLHNLPVAVAFGALAVICAALAWWWSERPEPHTGRHIGQKGTPRNVTVSSEQESEES
jgi:membrane protein implicated in regulation of membrane protease activity